MSWINAARAAVAAGILAAAGCAPSGREVSDEGAAVETEQLTIETANGPVQFTVEVADDFWEQSRGLMFRESLADDHGMLFDLPNVERASFWMRNTIISLDIIFIGPDGRILNIADHTTPYSEAPIPSAGLTRGVLEIRAGRAEELGIRPGDRVRHRIFPD
jgi:uncharacterized membrane protein (UPF0127 family)